MSDGDALLDAIRAHPLENVPRQMYADYLDEHGRHEWAEFVRVQVDLTRPGGDWGRLVPRERELWQGHCRVPWATTVPLPQPAIVGIEQLLNRRETSPPTPVLVVKRGFVSEYRGPSLAWAVHGDALRAAHPVCEVHLSNRPEYEYVAETGGYRLTRDPLGRVFDSGEVWDRGRLCESDRRESLCRVLGLLCLRWPGIEFDLS